MATISLGRLSPSNFPPPNGAFGLTRKPEEKDPGHQGPGMGQGEDSKRGLRLTDPQKWLAFSCGFPQSGSQFGIATKDRYIGAGGISAGASRLKASRRALHTETLSEERWRPRLGACESSGSLGVDQGVEWFLSWLIAGGGGLF